MTWTIINLLHVFGVDNQLICSTFLKLMANTLCIATDNGNKGIIGEPAYLEEISPSSRKIIVLGEFVYKVRFNWDKSQGTSGAIIIKNNQQAEFFLKSLTIEDFPGKGRIHFDCNSWVYNVNKYTYDRIFFANYVSALPI